MKEKEFDLEVYREKINKEYTIWLKQKELEFYKNKEIEFYIEKIENNCEIWIEDKENVKDEEYGVGELDYLQDLYFEIIYSATDANIKPGEWFIISDEELGRGYINSDFIGIRQELIDFGFLGFEYKKGTSKKIGRYNIWDSIFLYKREK